MFSKVFATVSVMLAVSSQVHGHGGVQPFFGVTGTLAKSDISKLVASSPCGNVDIASSLDTSTAVPAAADGTFDVTGVTFDTGSDGSESVSANVDPTATGASFTTPVTITTNGDPAPATTSVASPIVAALPAGTTCTGGAAGNLCLVQFVTTAGFANCVAVSQGAASTASNATTAATTASNATTAATTASNATTAATTASNSTTAATTASNTTVAAGTTAANTTTAATGKAAKKAAKAAAKAAKAAAGTTPATPATAKAAPKAGTRAARALLAELEARSEEVYGVAKRGLLSWVWA